MVVMCIRPPSASAQVYLMDRRPTPEDMRKLGKDAICVWERDVYVTGKRGRPIDHETQEMLVQCPFCQKGHSHGTAIRRDGHFEGRVSHCCSGKPTHHYMVYLDRLDGKD